MNDEGNESLDYMFSEHELKYYNFVAKPKFITRLIDSSTIPSTSGMSERM